MACRKSRLLVEACNKMIFIAEILRHQLTTLSLTIWYHDFQGGAVREQAGQIYRESYARGWDNRT